MRAERLAALIAQSAAPPELPDEGSKPEESVVMPATERIQQLEQIRFKCGGIIVPAPVLLPIDPGKDVHAQERDHQQNIRIVLTWLQEVAEKGTAQDVETAWMTIKDKRVRGALHDQSRQLRLQADRNFHKLATEAAAEEEAARRVWQRRLDIANLGKQIEADEKALAEKKQRFALLSAS